MKSFERLYQDDRVQKRFKNYKNTCSKCGARTLDDDYWYCNCINSKDNEEVGVWYCKPSFGQLWQWWTELNLDKTWAQAIHLFYRWLPAFRQEKLASILYPTIECALLVCILEKLDNCGDNELKEEVK